MMMMNKDISSKPGIFGDNKILITRCQCRRFLESLWDLHTNPFKSQTLPYATIDYHWSQSATAKEFFEPDGQLAHPLLDDIGLIDDIGYSMTSI